MMGEKESLGNESWMTEQKLGYEYISHNSHISAILVPNTTLQDKINVQQYSMVVWHIKTLTRGCYTTHKLGTFQQVEAFYERR
jgi:hypothetical protein